MDFTPGFTITSGSGTSTITVSINTEQLLETVKRYGTSIIILVVIIIQN
jgi:hypothetical protein